jgi:undecaprenyl diphosphate synthase
MDGNGRWAEEKGMPRFEGHRQGGKIVEEIVKACVAMEIEALTLYSFSMQNWKRPQAEIDFLMYLYTRYLIEIRPMLNDDNVRLYHLGRTDDLPQLVVDELYKTMQLTEHHTGLKLALALNYGSREEIVDAVKQISQKTKDGQLEIDDIDESVISSNLNTCGLPDPDLLVRTSGEMRISNFLLWQISYAEFYITDTYWPDFHKPELEKAVKAFASRKRRFGDVKDKKN